MASPGDLREMLQYTQRGRVPDSGCGKLAWLIDDLKRAANDEAFSDRLIEELGV